MSEELNGNYGKRRRRQLHNPIQRGSLNGTLITITPMEIRTFIVVLE